MNDLDAALRATYQARSHTPEPPDLLDEVLAIPDLDIPQQRQWLPPTTGRFQSMFSATKFVAAGAILALFGGFLLSGVLTQQPSDEPLPPAAASASATTQAEPTEATAEPEPTREAVADATPDLLPGVDLVTEEIEPGVYRVVSDGVRGLSGQHTDGERWRDGLLDTNIAAGLDGSIWLFGLDGFHRLGADTTHQWDDDSWRQGGSFISADIEIGPDGTIWLQSGVPVRGSALVNNGDIWSFDGESWTARREGGRNEVLWAVEVQRDGTVWTTWSTNPPGGKNKPRERTTVARLGADGWEDLPGSVQGAGSGWHDVIVTDGGEGGVWLLPGFGQLRRHDGTGWVVQPTPKAGGAVRAAVGPDGTLWVRLERCGSTTECPGGWAISYQSSIVARFDGAAWEVFRAKDGIPLIGHQYGGSPGFFEVAPDRRIWFNPVGDYCDGIANFDGQVLHRYLPGHCITAMDIAPDGMVWLRATERQPTGPLFDEPIHTYVITPEAVAAAE